MLLDETGDLGFLCAVDAFDQCDAEITVINAPDLHAAVRVTGTRVVDALDQGAAFHFDMEPCPLFNVALFNGIGNMIDLFEI
jgi:hypothetical protein